MKRLAAMLLLVNCACPPCEETPAVRSAKVHHVAPGDEAGQRPRIELAQAPAAIARVRRNPFAYVSAPPPVAPRFAAMAAPPPRVEVVASPEPPVVPAPAAPQFPYRYIGRFGRPNDPIAAFAGSGKVLTVRTGERIDDQFVLRAIGLESVQIEANEWPERLVIGVSSPL
jgi:hypothetical protein